MSLSIERLLFERTELDGLSTSMSILERKGAASPDNDLHPVYCAILAVVARSAMPREVAS